MKALSMSLTRFSFERTNLMKQAWLSVSLRNTFQYTMRFLAGKSGFLFAISVKTPFQMSELKTVSGSKLVLWNSFFLRWLLPAHVRCEKLWGDLSVKATQAVVHLLLVVKVDGGQFDEERQEKVQKAVVDRVGEVVGAVGDERLERAEEEGEKLTSSSEVYKKVNKSKRSV